jgi:Ser/Thr protein kinase RdoA (MazF antagonist)
VKPFDELTYLGQIRRLRGVARAALADYGLTDASLKFIARSENTTFRVTVPGPAPETAVDDFFAHHCYLLRIHRPGYQTLASITSELEWLSALRSEAGIVVPEPVPTITGELLAEVAVPGVQGPQTCSLLRWVKGRLIKKGFRLRHFRALGRLTAQLHQHVAHWEPPGGFNRRHWDWEGLFGDGAGFDLPASEVWELLPGPYHALFKTVADRVKHVMEAWGEGGDAFALIHADLSIGEEGNVIYFGGEARPIDFDDCGYGYWVWDFATSLAHWQEAGAWDSIRDAFMEGYLEIRRSPEEQLVHLDLFMAARHVSEMLWAVDLAQTYPDFRAELDEWMAYAARHVNRYLDGS